MYQFDVPALPNLYQQLCTRDFSRNTPVQLAGATPSCSK
jgi:hypothetical protein